MSKKKATDLTDTDLLDWLSFRNYVEATNNGAEDPDRFEWHATEPDEFRAALYKHIRKQKRAAIKGTFVTLQELDDRHRRKRG